MELDNSGASLCTSPPSENGKQKTAVRSQVVDTEGARENKGGTSIQLEIQDENAYEALYSASSQSRSESDGEETLFEATNSVRQESGADTVSEDKWKYQLLVKELEQVKRERDKMADQLTVTGTVERTKEQSFQEIAKELEQRCFTQQEQLECLQEQQEEDHLKYQKRISELEARVEQVTVVYEDAVGQKEAVIGKLALLEEGRKRMMDQITAANEKHQEDASENEKLQGVIKMQKADITKLQASCERSEAKCVELGQELAKGKEELSSLNIKVKWAQNKLKTETEAHKETKSQLTVTLKKLKEAREEGEQIRADLKTMIIQYQESEEMRSNSLDIQLKKTEKELKQNEQEIADQQQLHDLTVKELELAKAAHKIAQEECQQHKNKILELNCRLSDQSTETEELKSVVERLKQDQKKLTVEMAGLEQLNQTIEGERAKFSSLRDGFTQLQKSNQHLEREIRRLKERESELLAFSEKLSTANAELQAERSNWEAKVSSLLEEREQLLECRDSHESAMEELKRVREEGETQMEELVGKLEDKSKAVEQLSMALEDEREQIKVLRKKNSSNIKDLQRQLQQSKRRIEHLESLNAAEREPPATLPISDGSRASSRNSLDGIGGANASALQLAVPLGNTLGNTLGTAVVVTTSAGSVSHGGPVTHQGEGGSVSPDEERAGTSPSPELFQTLDQEKMVLVERMCKLKREMAKLEEKTEFFEEHAQQLTEDIQRKSKIIQNFIMREQSGALAPPSYDVHKARHSRKGGIMATVFSGKPSRSNPTMSIELSLEMNRKMQSVLEDTLLKNITLKENIDTLGQEIQRLSAQLQTYEHSGR